jgi:lipopolysaccharide export system permease protein
MRIIDRYVVREVIPPFLIALLVFTFVLIIPFIIDLAEQMIAKGVPGLTILRLTGTLLPQALALTIPMALLIGLLVGLGRLSADREVVVMMACGISPYRMLQPIAVLAVVCWGLTSWVMLKAMPDGNQAFREMTQEIVLNRAEGEVRPRVFFGTSPTWCFTCAKYRWTARAGSTCSPPTCLTRHRLWSTLPSAGAWSSIGRRRPFTWCSKTARGT